MREQTPQLPALIELLEVTDLTGSGYAVIRYGYRKVLVPYGAVADGPLKYASGDRFDILQARLAQATGSKVGNHECYEVTSPDGQRFYLWFRDWRVTAGTAIQPY